jgi:hypothetical protein
LDAGVVVEASSNDDGAPADAQPFDDTAGRPPTDASTSEEGASSEGGSSSVACNGSPAVVRQWTFDSDVQGWWMSMDTGVQGRLIWSSSIGNPSTGALEADVTQGSVDAGHVSGAWAQYDMMPLGDLTGRTISAWLWLDQGVSPRIKVFVQAGPQYGWADNGTILLTSHTWTCVSMPVTSPSYNGPNYDPTAVVRLGFEMRGTTPFRLYVDSVRYY